MVGYCTRRFARQIAAGVVEVTKAAAEGLPFPSCSFKKACTVNTVYFLEDPRSAVAELFRVLEPSGRLVIGFSPRAVLERVTVTRHGFTHYEPSEIERLLISAGFTSTESCESPGPRGGFVCTTAIKP